MLDKLEAIRARFEDLGVSLTNPAIVSDNRKFTELSKEYRSVEKIVIAYNQYREVLNDLDSYRGALKGDDEELREMAKEELPLLEEKKEQLEASIRQMLIPKDPQDQKNVILEIRGGTGGDEASLFAGDLLRMYLRYCERKGWRTAILSETEGTVGGYKEVQVEVTGDDVYGTLKFESGVHRVQRVPGYRSLRPRSYFSRYRSGDARSRRSGCRSKRQRRKNGNCPKRWRRRSERK
jgi:peptide chain release factor 1